MDRCLVGPEVLTKTVVKVKPSNVEQRMKVRVVSVATEKFEEKKREREKDVKKVSKSINFSECQRYGGFHCHLVLC